MADFVFNIAKGEVKSFAELPGGSDALVVVVITSAEADSSLKDYNDLAALLGGTSNEVTNTGYSRKTVTSVTISVDDTNDWVDIDIADQTWTGVASGDGWEKLLICYDGDTGAGTDSNITPLTAHDFVVTPDGSDITAQIASEGFFRAS